MGITKTNNVDLDTRSKQFRKLALIIHSQENTLTILSLAKRYPQNTCKNHIFNIQFFVKIFLHFETKYLKLHTKIPMFSLQKSKL